MPHKAKPQQKITTLDDFAAAIHADYLALGKKIDSEVTTLRGEMAAGFKAVRGEMYDMSQKMATVESLREVRHDLKMMTDSMVSKADLEETIHNQLAVSPFAKERDLTDLRLRVRRMEEKLGMKPSGRAA